MEPLTLTLSEGLCNRLRSMLSFLVVARREGRPLLVVWPSNAACPGTFDQVFEPLAGMTVVEAPPPGMAMQMAPPGHDFHPQVAARK